MPEGLKRERKIAPRDKLLVDLAAFANLLAPRLTAQSRLSHLELGLRIRRAYDDRRKGRLEGLLKPIWKEAIEGFSDPLKLGYPHVLPGGTIATPYYVRGTIIRVPGVQEWCTTPKELIEQVWIVRRLLWRIALEQRRRKKNGYSIWEVPLYASPQDAIPFPVQPQALLRLFDGVACHLDADLTATLATQLLPSTKSVTSWEELKNTNIIRLRICGAPYRRTRSRCCRLYVALTARQKDCSPQCRDLRLHTWKRHPRQSGSVQKP